MNIRVDDSASFNVRMIDCVGYIVPSALGYVEEDGPRMVMTPWYEDPIPFNMVGGDRYQKKVKFTNTLPLDWLSPQTEPLGIFLGRNMRKQRNVSLQS